MIKKIVYILTAIILLSSSVILAQKNDSCINRLRTKWSLINSTTKILNDFECKYFRSASTNASDKFISSGYVYMLHLVKFDCSENYIVEFGLVPSSLWSGLIKDNKKIEYLMKSGDKDIFISCDESIPRSQLEQLTILQKITPSDIDNLKNRVKAFKAKNSYLIHVRPSCYIVKATSKSLIEEEVYNPFEAYKERKELFRYLPFTEKAVVSYGSY